MRPAGRQKKLNPQEKKVNKILSNQNAREILKSRAITAINSQVEENIFIHISQTKHDLRQELFMFMLVTMYH